MYVLWTDCKIGNLYVIFISKSHNSFEKKCQLFFSKYHNKDTNYTFEKKSELVFSKELNKKDSYTMNYYYTEIQYINRNHDIYVLIRDTSDEKYSRKCKIELSNNKNTLIETATTFFLKESLNTTESDIKKMINNLENNKIYEIPEVRSHVSIIELYKLDARLN